ncbi:MAG: hypothetical protein WD989_01005 [Candidatus Paceibacterota bacterium]
MLKHKLFLTLIPAFAVVFAFGFFLGGGTNNASAQTECTVDRALLARIYNAIFHRPLDAGADFHVGRPLGVVLSDIEGSQEHTVYTGLARATKALEEARRAPGAMSSADLESYKRIIDSALSNVSAFADTLPEQAIENAVVGPDQARQVIQRAYDNLNPTARAAAEYGLFSALERLGRPGDISLPSLRPAGR